MIDIIGNPESKHLFRIEVECTEGSFVRKAYIEVDADTRAEASKIVAEKGWIVRSVINIKRYNNAYQTSQQATVRCVPRQWMGELESLPQRKESCSSCDRGCGNEGGILCH